MGKDKTEKKIVSDKKAKKSKKRKVEEAEDAAEEVVESPVKKEKKKKDKKRKAEDAVVEESPKKDKKAKKAKKGTPVKEAEAEESPKKKKKDKKKKKTVEEEAPPPAPVEEEDDDSSEEEEEKPAAAAEESADSDDDEEEDKMVIKSAPKPGDAAANPDGITEVFMGNLSFDIDDSSLKEAFKDCGEITNIKWLEHKDTGKFKGCGFISFGDAEMAAKAVGMNGQEVLGREIRVDFAKGKSAGAGGGAGGAGGGVRPMQEKPEGCTTLFCGNLNFNIDDDAMKDFFKDCGEVSSIRWLTDRDTGDFKGCGFVEFSDPDTSLDKAAAMNGNELMGRAVRLDYAAPRKPREKTW